ncbi:SLC13 family permease [Marinicella litoralis]|uniref:Sodium-dependent dicarboxylate transporter 2/3/5 n=1 Tax=Marinicella litoralis TaxID=644220 RepID=A0A4R6XP32_9GAMM|nr:SLC13 family permease [Marinicella litoralis]TDR19507.1 sodium-dependent dicarboxylate transporter 2/3/5 [Marinicella litoralis]
MVTKKIIPFLVISLLVFLLKSLSILNLVQALTLLITSYTAILWVTEWLPIPVASLIPVAFFPLLNIISPTEVAQAYGSPLIILLLGGFLLSTAMAHSKTHQYLANSILLKIGTDSPRRVILGFMLTSFLLSMWISNTATTLLLLPIALAVIDLNKDKKFAVILLLGIAYAASIGGTMTPIGTPPNLIMIQNYQQGTQLEIGFIDWMCQVAPMVMVFFPLMLFILLRQINNQQAFKHKITVANNPMNTAQKRTLWVFALTAFLWVSRTAPMGGWKTYFDLPFANDASVALIGVLLMFMISDGKGGKLLNWKTANTIPWGVLLLFAGGMVIASAFKSTGLSVLLADQLIFLQDVHLFFIIFAICFAITFLTEITSNMATTAIIMPILFSVSGAIGIDPLKIMIPAAISASCAFMLPVATAPNAIVYGAERIPIKSMIKQGFKLNVVGAVVISSIATWWL